MSILQEVSNKIASLMSIPEGMERKKAAHSIVKNLRDNENITKLLESYLENVVDGKISLQANFNPNGFYKVGIFKGDKSALRLHVAHSALGIPAEGRIEENAHDHRWSLYSLSLAGKISHEILGKTKNSNPNAEILHQYSYGPRGGSDFFEMFSLRESYLVKTGVKNPQPGDITVLDSYTVHRASGSGYFVTGLVKLYSWINNLMLI